MVTVFTPSYNRHDLLGKCYESLKKQTSFNFLWLIVDDGSTDDTQRLVKSWSMQNNPFEIRYVFKKNGGLHTAYNKAIELTDTELMVCIDSDDWMPENAIEKIERIWTGIHQKGYVGIMGLDIYKDGSCVGDAFPKKVKEMYLYEKMIKYHLQGDKKMIYRTDLLKKVAPMPSFGEERFFNPSYMMYQLDRYGKLFVVNTAFCIVDYQPDGMSSNIFKQCWDSPRSFAETRKLYMRFPDTTLRFLIRQNIHYASSCMIARRLIKGIKESPYPGLTALCIVPGIMLSILVYIKK